MADTRILAHNEKSAAGWGSAGEAYEKFSEDLGDAIDHCIRCLEPRPGQRVLDVATGTGWGARRLAAFGAEVHGIDFSKDLIEAGRRRASELGVELQLSTADAEDLPFDGASFDAVISTFGVMFVQTPAAAAGELVRVCRPGGRLGLTTWTADGAVAQLVRDVMVPYRPPPPDPPPPSPYLWGKSEYIDGLLGDTFDLHYETGCNVLRGTSGEDIWRKWSISHGPTMMMLKNLTADRRSDFKRDFIAFHERFRTGSGIVMECDYLVTVGTRK